MDELDHQLIRHLQKDPRKNNTELAKLAGVTEATVRRRINSLVSSGTIVLTALPNPQVFGYSTICYIGLLAKISMIKNIGERLCQYPQVYYVSICAGFTDILIRGNFHSMGELARFVTSELGQIQGVLRIETMVQLRELKRTHGAESFAPEISRNPLTQSTKAALDETDHRIVFELQKDARISCRRLAQIVGVSGATAFRRLEYLVASGSIQLTAILDPIKIGYHTRCFVALEVELPKIDSVATRLTQYPQVNYVGIMSGPVQVLAAMYATSTENIAEFVTGELGGIDGIVRANLLVQMKCLKAHGLKYPHGPRIVREAS